MEARNGATRLNILYRHIVFFFSSRRRHTRLQGDWSSDVCSSDLDAQGAHDLAGTMADCLGIGQIHRQFQRLFGALGKVDEFEKLTVLAPMIKFKIGRASCRERV